MASTNGTQGCGHYCRAKGKCNGCCASQARGILLPRDLNDKLRAEFEKVRSLPRCSCAQPLAPPLTTRPPSPILATTSTQKK